MDEPASSTVGGGRSSLGKISEALKGKPFVFVVGQEATRFHAHIPVLATISKPLATMMTGKMEEGIKGEAVLKDVDPDAFGELLDFAYSGLCGISNAIFGPPAQFEIPNQYRCNQCNRKMSSNPSLLTYPFCDTNCVSAHKTQLESHDKYDNSYTSYCVRYDCGDAIAKTLQQRILCASHREDRTSPWEYPRIGLDNTHGTATNFKPGDPFLSLSYGAAGLSHRELSEKIEQHRSHTSTCPTLPAGALLLPAETYLLSQLYDIPALQQISLRKLHRNLSHFSITTDSLTEVKSLIELAYDNSADKGDMAKGLADPLRQLVMTYVVDRAGELLQFEDFRDMLGGPNGGGKWTGDFMALKYAKDKT